MNPLARLAKPQYLYSPSRLLLGLYRRLLPTPKRARIVTMPWGAHLRIDPSEEIGATIWKHGIYDLVVTETIWRLLDPGDTAVDGGANIGYMTLLMAALVAPRGRVVAFEPHQRVFEDLLGNLSLFREEASGNELDLDARAAALSDIGGLAHLVETRDFATNRGRAHISDSTEGQLVSKVSLDQVFPTDELTLLKLDLEGHERTALDGAMKLFRERRIKHVVCEAHESQRQDLHDFFRTVGYTSFGLGRTFERPVLSHKDQPPPLPAHEAPSLLASIEPDFVEERFRQPGWFCLRGKNLAWHRSASSW